MSLPQGRAGLAPAVLQLNFIRGEAREQGPYAVVRPLRVDGAPACLLLAAEAGGSYPEDTCRLLAGTVVSCLADGRRSLSGRLQAALSEVHQQLLEENTRSMPGHEVGLSAACALLREDDLLIALGGPALALVFTENGMRDLAAPPGGLALPLGSQAAQVWVRRHTLQPGERLLLLSSDAVLEDPRDPLLGTFRAGMERGMARLYHSAGRLPAFGAIALEQRPPEQSRDREEAEEHQPAKSPKPYSYGRDGMAPHRQPAPIPEPPGAVAARVPVSVDLRMPVVSTRRGGGLPPRLLAGLGLLSSIVVLYLVLQAASQERQAQALAHAAALLGESASLVSQAEAAVTGDIRRRLLTDARRRLDAVRRQEPDNPDAAQLAGVVQEQLERLDAVHSLGDPRPVLEAGNLPGSTGIFRDLVEQDGTVYLLDKSGDRIIQVPVGSAGVSPVAVAGSSASVVYQGRGGAARRNLITLLSLPRGGAWRRDSLLAIDENRGLLEIRPGAEAQPLPLRGAAEWGSFQAAAGYEGSLYVLDPRESQVYRYVPTETGFDTERRTVLPSVDLRDAVDLAVDGDIYVLLRTGRVLKFTGNRPQTFTLDGLDTPLSGQSVLFADKGPTLYVADQANRRVVAFDKADGRFLRQFPTGDLGTVQALLVQESARRLFLATDNRVYVATLP